MDRLLVTFILLISLCGCTCSGCSESHVFCLYNCCADGDQFCCFFAIVTGGLAGFAVLATVAVVGRCFCKGLACFCKELARRFEIKPSRRSHLALTTVGISNPTCTYVDEGHTACTQSETTYMVLNTPALHQQADTAA